MMHLARTFSLPSEWFKRPTWGDRNDKSEAEPMYNARSEVDILAQALVKAQEFFT